MGGILGLAIVFVDDLGLFALAMAAGVAGLLAVMGFPPFFNPRCSAPRHHINSASRVVGLARRRQATRRNRAPHTSQNTKQKEVR
ncbi:MAG: hypothetical protein VX859_00600, partial [Pseudomonadota bacterium]|nr:hypothetical protein [Pseudomonadota bacterium]